MVKEVIMKRGKENFIEIDGEKFAIETTTFKKVDGVEHEDKVIFKKVNKKEYKENIGIIVKEIGKKTTKKELLEHLVTGMAVKELRAIAKRIKAKKPIKKQKGCLGFKIGDRYMEIIE